MIPLFKLSTKRYPIFINTLCLFSYADRISCLFLGVILFLFDVVESVAVGETAKTTGNFSVYNVPNFNVNRSQ